MRRLTADEIAAKINRKKRKHRPKILPSPYNSMHQRVRAVKLKMRPSCERCGGQATQVHHVVSIRDGGAHELGNLMSVCANCHVQIEREKRGAGAAIGEG